MIEWWRAALNDNKIVGAIFIDFRKAFDTISYGLLPLKLQEAGIMGDSYNWILDFRLSIRQISVHHSEWLILLNKTYKLQSFIRFLTGTKAVFDLLNELPNAVTDGEVEMYADDTTAYCTGDNFDTVTKGLNLIFKQIYRWPQRNRLSIRNGKSEAMRLSTKPLIGPI